MMGMRLESRDGGFPAVGAAPGPAAGMSWPEDDSRPCAVIGGLGTAGAVGRGRTPTEAPGLAA